MRRLLYKNNTTHKALDMVFKMCYNSIYIISRVAAIYIDYIYNY